MELDLPHVTIPSSFNVLMEEHCDQLLCCLSSLVYILRVTVWEPLQLLILRRRARAARYWGSQMRCLGLALGGRATSSTRSLGGRVCTVEEASAVGIEILVGKLLD